MTRDEILLRLSEVIRTDATNSNYTDFFATHVPFKSLKYANSGVEGDLQKVIDEETFYKEKILSNRNNHALIVVEGKNGSGKSHFIRWCKERYMNDTDPSKEAVLTISREQSSLKGALEQIVNSNIFPEGFDLNDIKKLIQANEHLNDEMLKQNILMQFASIAKMKDKYTNAELDNRYSERIYQFLVDINVQDWLFKKDGPIERIKQRLNPDEKNKRQDEVEPKFYPDDFALDTKQRRKMVEGGGSRDAIRLAEDLTHPSRGALFREQLSKFLNSKLEEVVYTCTNLRAVDMKHIFEQLRITLKQYGKNLTVFIEDITSFTGIDKALVDVLTTVNEGNQNLENYCKIFSVVGVTESYYKEFRDNFKDRVTGRVLIDDAVLTNPEEVGEMAARYINAIYLSKLELKEWIEQGANDLDLPISLQNIEHDWANFKISSGKTLSMYPLNLSALWNMYQNLIVKTPRAFLNGVIRHVFLIYADNIEQFPPAPNELEGQFRIPQWVNPLHERSVKSQAGPHGDRICTLLRIWGDRTAVCRKEGGVTTIGGLQKEVFDAFGLPFIQGVGNQTSEPAVTTKPNINQNLNPSITTTTLTPPEEDRNQAEFMKIQIELDEWVKGGKLRSYQNLREDVYKVLIDFVDWEFEGVPGLLVKSFFNNSKVSIEGQIGRIDEEGFQVKRSERSKYALLSLASWRILGNKSWNFNGSSSYLTYLHQWMTEVKDDVVRSVKAPRAVKSVTEWDLLSWGLLSEFYIYLFSGNLSASITSVKDIYFKFFDKTPEVKGEDERSSDWKDIQNRLKRRENDIANHHDFVIRFYNCVQGSVTGNTDVFFINAVPILEKIKELVKSEWKIDIENFEGVEQNKDNRWYQSLSFLDLFKSKGETALLEEVKKISETLEELKALAGDDAITGSTEGLFEQIKELLEDTFSKANIRYESEHYRGLTEKALTPIKFKNAVTALRNIQNSENRTERSMRISSNPVRNVNPYLELFKNLNKLLDDKYTKYHSKLNELQSQSGDLQKVIKETEEALEKLIKNFVEINKGEGLDANR